MRTLRMAGLGECPLDTLHPEDEEVARICLRYAGSRLGDGTDFVRVNIFLYTSVLGSWSRTHFVPPSQKRSWAKRMSWG